MEKYQLVIMAAGKGTRMRSDLPKVLHRVCGLTLIERILRAGTSLRPTNVVVVTGFGADLVEREVRRVVGTRSLNVPIVFAHQLEQRGTGDAVRTALPFLNDDRVFIAPGDMPLLDTVAIEEIVAGDMSYGHPDVLAVSFHAANPTGYGRIVRDPRGSVSRVVEERDATPEIRKIAEVNSSLYCAGAAFLRNAIPQLHPKNAQSELYLTDILEIAASGGKRAEALCCSRAVVFSGANSRAELSDLERVRREEINHKWMESGVTMEDPERTYIDEDVTLASDCYLGAGTRLCGATKIDRMVRITGDAVVCESTIGAGTEIALGCSISNSAISSAVRIGPFTHLVAGTLVGEGAEVGSPDKKTNTASVRGGIPDHLSYQKGSGTEN